MNTEAQSVDGEQKTEDGETPSTVARPPSSRARKFLSILLMMAILVGFSALVFIFRDQIIRLSLRLPRPLLRRRCRAPALSCQSRASPWLLPPAHAEPLCVGLAIGTGAAVGELTGYMAGVGGHGLIADNQPTSGCRAR